MKSVCMIGNFASYSGAFEVFRNVARHAKTRGWATHYLCHANRLGEIVPDVSMFDTADCIPNEGVDRDEYGRRLAEEANRFGIVHTSLLPQDWRFKFKRYCTRPMVETYHSPDGWARCWRQYKLRLKGGHERPAEAMVGVSKGLAAQIAADMGPGVLVQPIFNGIRIPDESARGGKYVTFCGRISADKGLEDWIAVAERVRRAIPSAKFQWVGALSPQYDPFLLKCLQKSAPWIEMVGFQEDPSPYYRRSKCLLLTSPSEGLPMTILEAHAHGIPSVAYDVGDVGEAGGFTVPKGDVATAARRVIALFKSTRFVWAAVGGKARKRAMAEFSIEAMGRNYLDLYDSLLTKTVAASADIADVAFRGEALAGAPA